MGADHYESSSDLSSPEAESSSTGQRRRRGRPSAGYRAKRQKTQKNKKAARAESEDDMEEEEEEVDEEKQDQQEDEEDGYEEHVHTILQLALPKGTIVTEDTLRRASRAFGAIIKEASASAAATVAGKSGNLDLHRTVRQPLKKKDKAPKVTLVKGAKAKKAKSVEPPLGEKYEVEAITDHSQTPAGRYEFLIKWKGYPLSDCTWEPLSALTGCQELLAGYAELHDIAL